MKRSLLLLLLMLCFTYTITFGALNVSAEEPYIKLECEECDGYTEEENIYGNDANRYIKIEEINVGGTFPGAWIMFEGIEFYGKGASKVSINYAKHPDKCAEDTKLEFRLGAVDGELIGEVALTKAEGWGNYNLATADLNKVVTGTHDLYVVMKGTHSPQYVYIGQLDYIEFTEAEESNSSNNDNNNENKGGDDGTNRKGSDKAPQTADPSMIYIAAFAIASAIGGLRLRKHS